MPRDCQRCWPAWPGQNSWVQLSISAPKLGAQATVYSIEYRTLQPDYFKQGKHFKDLNADVDVRPLSYTTPVRPILIAPNPRDRVKYIYHSDKKRYK